MSTVAKLRALLWRAAAAAGADPDRVVGAVCVAALAVLPLVLWLPEVGYV